LPKSLPEYLAAPEISTGREMLLGCYRLMVHDECMAIDIPDECAGLIALQSGVIGRSQAIDRGLHPESIKTLLRTSRWQTLQRGVYATFTGPPGRAALLWSALVRAGPEAMLSHQTAAELYRLASQRDRREAFIHLTVPRDSNPTHIHGAVVHRVGRAAAWRHPHLLPPRTRIEATVLDLVDAADSVDGAFGWVCRATGKGLTNANRLHHAIGQRSTLRWRKAMLDALGDVEQGVRSNLEYRYVRGVERPHDLPRAQRQVRVMRSGRACYLDDLYGAYAVGVELDGLVAHPPGERWRDFRRDNAGAADGVITLRYGWADVTGRPCEVAGQVAAVLRRRGWAGSVRACGPSCAAASAGNAGHAGHGADAGNVANG
jgi:hypothetical protein